MDPIVTNVDLGGVIYEGGEFRDSELTFAGAGTVLEGTILARDSVSGKLVPYVIGGATNENGIPKSVLTYEVTATGAGDAPVRDMITGTVRAAKLVVDADGDGSNLTPVILDELRDYSLVSVDTTELNILDNQ